VRRTWHLIIFTALISLLCWAATLIGVQALAQSPADSAPADERGSADNSVSFPVDI